MPVTGDRNLLTEVSVSRLVSSIEIVVAPVLRSIMQCQWNLGIMGCCRFLILVLVLRDYPTLGEFFHFPFLSPCLRACLPVRLFVRLSFGLPTCLPACLPAGRPARLPVCLSVLSVSLITLLIDFFFRLKNSA